MERSKHYGMSGIVLNHKLGPVYLQNLRPGRGNGVSTARNTDQVLRPLKLLQSSVYMVSDRSMAHLKCVIARGK